MASSIWAGVLLACVDGARDAGGGGLVRLCLAWESGPSTRPRASTQVNKQRSCTRWHCGAPGGTPGPIIRHYLQ